MGDFIVRVHAVVRPGRQRNVKHGETLEPRCGNPSCPGCLAREFVEKLRATGNIIYVALTRWPADTPNYASQPLGEVRDDLVTDVPRSSF